MKVLSTLLASGVVCLFLDARTGVGDEIKLTCHKIVNKTTENKSDYHIEVEDGNEIEGVGKGTWDNVNQQGRKADWTGDDLIAPNDFCIIYLRTKKEYDPKDGKWTPNDKLAMSIGVRTDYDGQGGVVLALLNKTPGVPSISISNLNVYTNVPLADLPVFGPIESLPNPKPGWTHAITNASANLTSSVSFNLTSLPIKAVVAYFDYQGVPTDPTPFGASLLQGSHTIAAIENAPVPAIGILGQAGLGIALIAAAAFLFARRPRRPQECGL